MPRIAIIGGGLSGVSCAYELARQPHANGGHTSFVLFESTSRLGGIVETHRPGGLNSGFVVECGADSWVTEKPWARELAIELGLENEIIPSNDAHRCTYLLQDGKLVPMPEGMRMMVPTDLEAIAASPLFSESARQAYRAEPQRAEELKAFARARPDDWDESIASFVERHFGVEVTEKIAGPLLAGVFGGDIRQLSVAAVMAPFVKMERDHGSLILALQRQSATSKSRPVFTSLKGGLESLIDGMTAIIPSSTLRLNEAVQTITPKSGKWEVATASSADIFDKIVVATPVHVTRKLVAPWQNELQGLLDVEATSAVVAAFAFDRTESAKLTIPEGFGFLVPQRYDSASADPQILACTFVDQKFSHRAPEGCIVLRAFYGGNSAPALLAQPDDFIRDLACRHLSAIFGEIPKAQIQLVRRWPLSLPQYTVGHSRRIARVEALVAAAPGLHLIGNSLHGVGLPDMVRLGRATATALLA